MVFWFHFILINIYDHFSLCWEPGKIIINFSITIETNLPGKNQNWFK